MTHDATGYQSADDGEDDDGSVSDDDVIADGYTSDILLNLTPIAPDMHGGSFICAAVKKSNEEYCLIYHVMIYNLLTLRVS